MNRLLTIMVVWVVTFTACTKGERKSDFLTSENKQISEEVSNLSGTWRLVSGNPFIRFIENVPEDFSSHTSLLIFSKKHWTFVRFNPRDRQFYSAKGGSYSFEKESISFYTEYDSENENNFGAIHAFKVLLDQDKRNKLCIWMNGGGDANQQCTFQKMEAGSQDHPMMGAWLNVSMLNRNGKMIEPLSTVIEIFTDNYYVISIYDVENQHFAGAGGGTYFLSSGQLFCNVEFYSWDSTWVGEQLVFDCILDKEYCQLSGVLNLENFKNRKVEEHWERLD
ncbi:hypothetical protein AAG747_25650 [Rapidithrix thailandica]|uniref:Uncharacterized protein n=1 Tax=Rapidithrix thailandica TaxID=413964 RepID=A0AAW9SJG7_9BACT